MKPITILALDPGTHNFAASILRGCLRKDQLAVQIVGTKMIPTIKDMKDAQSQHNRFISEIVELYNDYGFSYIVAERYQTRGIKGKTVECINLMLGIILNEFSDLDISFLTASTWKNRYNNNLDLNDLYEDLKEAESDKKVVDRKTVHELDCSLLGVYRLCAAFGKPYFENISTYKREQSFLNHFLTRPIL